MQVQKVPDVEAASLRAENSLRPQFWKGNKADHDYWNLYLTRRPKYDRPFYDLIFEFHRGDGVHDPNSNEMKDIVAHDMATGPGQVAAYLEKHFSKVIASDANAAHLWSAEHFHPSSKIEYVAAEGQDLLRLFPRASAGMVTIAEALPLMPIQPTIASAAHLLCSGGTMAIWFYGRPHFVPDAKDPSFEDGACNRLYGNIATSAFQARFRNATTKQIESIQMTMANMSNWLDHVHLPENDWLKIERYKWNKDLKMEFIDHTDPILGWSSSFDSRIEEGEIKPTSDSDIWSEMWTVTEWKEFLDINLPPVGDATDKSDTTLAPLWNHLAELMGGESVTRKVRWPVVLILATRR